MKQLLYLAPLTLALLTSCPETTPIPVTLDKLTVSGVTGPLLIDSTARVTVTATGTDGQPFTGTPTFVSSNPQAVSIAADGTITARHLSSAPVIITATQSGKTATLSVSTYGLDATGGNYSSLYKAAPSIYDASNFLAVFKDASGTKATSGAVTVTGPATYNGDKSVAFDLSTVLLATNFPQAIVSTPLISGSYVASLAVGNVVYKKTFVLDAAKVLAPPSGVSLTATATGYTLGGTAPVGAAGGVQAFVASSNSNLVGSQWQQVLPATGTWGKTLASGTDAAYVVSSSALISPTGTLPDQLNLSDYQLNDVIIP